MPSALRIAPLWLTLTLFLAGCGGGGGGGAAGVACLTASNGVVPPATAANQVAVIVEQDPALANSFSTANLPYVSVTLCDSANHCQTIDHIVLDTGSYGLRVLASALNTTVNLTAATATGGGALGECATFLGGYMWGGVRSATVKINGETASNLPIELIEDPALPSSAPASCKGTGQDIGNLAGIGGNGLLGVGQFVEDQGSYYACTGATTGSCSPTVVAATSQVSNPVAFFAANNNGMILQMPSISCAGQISATGTLTFGIDTQSNNSLKSYSILPADAQGNFTATIAGQSYPGSFIDSGSDFNFITLSGLGTNGYGDYAPAAYTIYSGTLSSDHATATVYPAIPIQFGVVDTTTLNFSAFTAFNDIVDPGSSGAADFGMPFFYGQSVGLLIAGKTVAEGSGPFYALH